ncbi:MAG: alkaline phosphatase family protein [Spirochaetales bacterium]|nr:alkaline phosphatase family protein [Spirochaetales bacterium]
MGTQYKKLLVLGLDAALPDLLIKFSEEGSLPHIKKLMGQGIFSRVKTVFPPLTAAAWSAIVTGAGPGTAGIPSLMVKLPGEELDNWHTSFDRRMLLAQTLWEVAGDNGLKTALINWPVTWPIGAYKNCIQVAASLNPPFRYFYMPIWDIASSSFYSTEKHFCNQIPGRAVQIFPKPASDREKAAESKLQPLEFSIEVPPVYAKGLSYHVLIISKTGEGYDSVKIFKSKTDDKPIAELAVSEKSELQYEVFTDRDGHKRKGRFRFELIDLSSDGKTCKLFAWAINTAESYTSPPELTGELEKEVGPYLEVDDPWAYMDQWVELSHYMNQLQTHADWWGNATTYVLKNKQWDLAFSWVGTVDHVQHVLYGGIVPESKLFDPEKYNMCFDNIRLAYKQIDRNIGKILESVNLDETLVVAVSDHGFTHNDWNPYLKTFLAKAGLLSYNTDSETGRMEVNWKKTKCHPLEPSHAHIFINLKGRDPQGIVEIEDYEKVQEEIKKALYSIKDPVTGEQAMAAVLTKQEASTLGTFEGPGWDRIGDVLFAFKPGFLANTFIYPAAVKYADGTERMIPNPEEHEPSILGRHFSGAHVTLPGIKEMEAAIIISGKNLPSKKRKLTMDIIDIAPTIAWLLGIPCPKDSEGGICQDFMQFKAKED